MEDSFFCVTDSPSEYYDCFMKGLISRNPGESEFHQAVSEVADSILPYIFQNSKYLKAQVLERLTEPDRVVSFRVSWEDDEGRIRTNRGYRVQYCNAIGPYKGGLRFHPSVNQSILKFLAFEQIFKNSLTGLPIGAGKGGANFNPKGKSDSEIMRFCQSYMTELYRHIGANVDVPAGDIGVGAREISYMYGQYKRITNNFVGALTGKSLEYGGSLIRAEATGYGLIYFTDHVLKKAGNSLEGQRCLISGSGNVAQFAAEKLIELGARVTTLSDSRGFLHFDKGLTKDSLEQVKNLKNAGKSLKEFAGDARYFADRKPWGVEAEYAFPCATQNEILLEDAKSLVKHGIKGVFEGANMPTGNDAMQFFLSNEILFGPAKAANAGGVAISALEMSQNRVGMGWDRATVDDHLKRIMKDIFDTCVHHGAKNGKICYVTGANVGGFVKVANAMLAFGIT